MEQTTFALTEQLLQQAVADGVFPGAAFGVLHRGRVVAAGAVGRFTYDEQSPAVTPATSFDLASVSKVAATTAMAMLLWQQGRLALDTLLGDLLPGFVVGIPDRRRAVTLRMLLAHASGLPVYAPFFEQCRSPRAVLAAALRLGLAHEPGSMESYSDPGFILLGKALEVLAGEPLDRWCAREIFAPLGMRHTRYNPPVNERPAIPPTEIKDRYRQGTVQGEVHDENCFALGGVAGHAGLFAPVADLLRFAEAMLAPLRAEDEQHLFRAETVRLFTARAGLVPGSSRALGWDTPSAEHSSAGTCFHPSSFGHLGYTGTSLWIDPVADLAAVLLTNRTFPTRKNRKIQELRPRFHDVVFRDIQGAFRV